MKTLFCIICFFIVSYRGFTQYVLSFGSYANLGRIKPCVNQNNSISKISEKYNLSAVFNHREFGFLIDNLFNMRLGFSIGFSGNSMKWNFENHQTYAIDNDDIFRYNFSQKLVFTNYFTSLSYNFRFKNYRKNFLFLRLIGGISNFENQNSQSLYFSNDTIISLISNCNLNYLYFISPEVGFCFLNSKSFFFRIYTGWHFVESEYLKIDLYQKTSENIDNISITPDLSSFYVGFGFGIRVFRSASKLNLKLPKLRYNNIDFFEYNNQNEITSIKKRKLIYQHTIFVNSPVLELFVRDYANEDNDKISLYLNQQIILKKYTIKNESLKVDLQLNEGDNFLTIYAHNLGKTPPNTVLITYFENGIEKKVAIKSTLHECGAIKIVYMK